MKISEVIANMEALNKMTPYNMYCCPLCEGRPNYVTSKSLKAHLSLRHGDKFDPEEQPVQVNATIGNKPEPEVNYLGIFKFDDDKLRQKRSGLIYAEKIGGVWLCRTCKHCSTDEYELLAHCYKHWKKDSPPEPESDGQAEQHLGAESPNAEWMAKSFWSGKDKSVYNTYVMGEWGKDEQPTNKYDNGKPRLDLVPPAIIEAVGEIRTYGNKKYGDSESWHTVEPARYRAALMRHLCAYLRDPKSKDEESGLSHLAHMSCNIAFLLELEKEGKV